MRKTIKAKALLMTGIVSVAVTLSGCSTEEETTIKKDIVVEAQIASEGELVLQNEFIGSITPEEEIYVVPLVNAKVTNNYVAVGDTVSEGDLLCEFDDSAADLQVKSANAALAGAQASKNLTTGGQAAASNIQAEANIQTIKDNQAALQIKYDALLESKEELKKQMEALKDSKKQARTEYEHASQKAEMVQGYGANMEDEAYKQALKDAGYDLSKTPQQLLTEAITERETKKAVYEATKSAYDTNYPALESQMSTIEQSQKELENSASSLNHSLQAAQKSYNLSNGQIKNETEAVYQSQINSAAVGVESAKYQQDMYRLTAPISGVVEAVNVMENSFASSGSAAYVISNKNSMTVTFYVSEDIRNTLKVGDKLLVDRNGSNFEATITEIGQMVDGKTGLFLVKGTVKASGNELLTGTSVKITANTYRTSDGLLIPYDAVYYDNGQAYVYVAEEGKAVKKLVEVGLFSEDTAAVISGIEKDDKVITTWSPLLSDGVSIVIKETADKEAETEEANE